MAPSSQRGDTYRSTGMDRVALAGGLIGMVSLLLLPWLTLKPNRLAAGEPLLLLEVMGGRYWILLVLAIVSIAAAIAPLWRPRRLLLALVGNVYILLCAYVPDVAAGELLKTTGEFARVSLSASTWLSLAGGYVIVYASGIGLRSWRAFLTRWTGILLIVVFGLSGRFVHLSITQEYLTYSETFFAELVRHLLLVVISLGAGAALGLLLGIWTAFSPRLSAAVLAVVSVIQTVPTLALLGLLIVPLAALGEAVPLLSRLGLRGIGPAPAIAALTLYSLLPIVRNTYTSLREVDPSTREAGLGMGLTRRQLLYLIEIPLALPVIVEGIRISAVSLVGLAALVSLIGAGGLGTFIFQGIGQAAPDLVLLGSLPVIALAVIADILMRRLSLASVPRGLRKP